MNLTPYLYAIVAYFILMLLSKIAYAYFVGQRKTEKAVQPSWNFNLGQLRQTLMSIWF